ncbi:LIM and SH3 domain protein F42H10.3 [Trichinella sp. T6]|nr:LIM and SH3 domain protein F42H10.3 [Trichinella sp. T6]
MICKFVDAYCHYCECASQSFQTSLLSFGTASKMMAPSKCARPDCGKTVYPMEELKCLDQVWHKQCFRCTACNMVLTMKNYKGYEKQPYCEAHYPKTKASVVADTPEMRRLQENTKNQSLRACWKSGDASECANSFPSIRTRSTNACAIMLTLAKSPRSAVAIATALCARIKYHEEYERMMKGKKIQVADDPEIQRLLKNTQIQSNVIYHGDLDRKETMERIRPPLEETVASNIHNAGGMTNNSNAAAAAAPTATANKGTTNAASSQAGAATIGQQHRPAVSSSKAASSPYSAKLQQSPTLIYSTERGGRVAPQSRVVGSIDNYDPMNGQWGSIVSNRQNYKISDRANYGLSPPANTTPAPAQNVVKRRSGGTAASNTGLVVRALYDYSANDSDEVTFKEGDLIINCQTVDKGWMTGTVQRTGKWGMLPANYVERVN